MDTYLTSADLRATEVVLGRAAPRTPGVSLEAAASPQPVDLRQTAAQWEQAAQREPVVRRDLEAPRRPVEWDLEAPWEPVVRRDRAAPQELEAACEPAVTQEPEAVCKPAARQDLAV